MAEYISREEAIKELREVYENEYPTASGDFDEYASHDVPNVLRNIPAADVQSVDRWISCKDKMPEDNTSVLFVYVSENGIRSVHYGYHQTIKGLGSSWAKTSGGWQYCDDDVTYWQPLPEAPKMGGAENG